MKSGTTLLLFLLGAFGLVVVLVELPAYTMFTGEIFIVLFIAGLLFALWNAIREGRKFAKRAQSETPAY
ncbi:MAG: hypothetical protein JRN20_08810 [Nitrososphaerota archaeon]|nr:hypothetical protein [Nitrososphaerota archaeon]MDG6921870.1 hypothetical protein [Nitrososphaerota archaeon]